MMKKGQEGRVWSAYWERPTSSQIAPVPQGGLADVWGPEQPCADAEDPRRQVGYEMENSRTFSGARSKFLARSPDQCFETKEFIRAGVPRGAKPLILLTS
jgi:hypothetical protein